MLHLVTLYLLYFRAKQMSHLSVHIFKHTSVQFFSNHFLKNFLNMFFNYLLQHTMCGRGGVELTLLLSQLTHLQYLILTDHTSLLDTFPHRVPMTMVYFAFLFVSLPSTQTLHGFLLLSSLHICLLSHIPLLLFSLHTFSGWPYFGS